MENIDFETKVVEMKGITKKFGDFVANHSINLTVHKGEVHALLGENGAGKSTLMNILYGLYQPNTGEIFIKGQKANITDSKVAIALGIGMVHQHFMLVKPFTVTENIVLGNETTSFGCMNLKKAAQTVKELSLKYGLTVDPDAKIQDISVGMQQRVEILKLLYRGADIIILDEPTAVLTPQEIRELIVIIKNLTKEGKSVILISHKLKELKDCADFCTIIRRGVYIDTVKVADTSIEQLAAKMVGREVSFAVEKADRETGREVLNITNLTVKDNRGLKAVDNFSLTVRAGEIVGIAGIDGNGQSELLEAMTGLRKSESGTISVNGKDITGFSPLKVMNSKVAHIPEDRQKRGLVLDFTVSENMVLENHAKAPFAKRGVLNQKEIDSFACAMVEKFDVRPRNITIPARNLSGGNQQKVIIAREVTQNPDLLIAAQPTRGLDVGSIEYIHKSLVAQRDKDKAVLLVSLELDEVMNVSDRIAVMYKGKIVAVFDSKEADVDTIGLLMAGGSKN